MLTTKQKALHLRGFLPPRVGDLRLHRRSRGRGRTDGLSFSCLPDGLLVAGHSMQVFDKRISTLSAVSAPTLDADSIEGLAREARCRYIMSTGPTFRLRAPTLRQGPNQ
jgi:hypothetical protein